MSHIAQTFSDVAGLISTQFFCPGSQKRVSGFCLEEDEQVVFSECSSSSPSNPSLASDECLHVVFPIKTEL
jgi:hypothetical protein